MAKYCSEECRDVGAICDFCKHYKDSGNDSYFEGKGICEITMTEVFASDYCEDDFICRNVREDDEQSVVKRTLLS